MSAPAMLGVAAASLALALPLLGASAALEAVHRAAGAADAAALAAADAVSGWILYGEECELAKLVAQAADVVLESCDSDTASGQVRIRVSVQTIFGKRYAHARAGPSLA